MTRKEWVKECVGKVELGNYVSAIMNNQSFTVKKIIDSAGLAYRANVWSASNGSQSFLLFSGEYEDDYDRQKGTFKSFVPISTGEEFSSHDENSQEKLIEDAVIRALAEISKLAKHYPCGVAD